MFCYQTFEVWQLALKGVWVKLCLTIVNLNLLHVKSIYLFINFFYIFIFVNIPVLFLIDFKVETFPETNLFVVDYYKWESLPKLFIVKIH